MERFIRAWPRDRKIVVQRGWAQFPQFGDADHIKIVGKVSHDQLFRHASAIIHHGGAGTTASALHAGVPQIVVPHIGDQNYFGSEVERFGCGFRLKKNIWPEQLHHALERLLSEPTRSARAAEIGRELRAADGPAAAVRELEDFVASRSAPLTPA
jgi:vancomycin aglycone glucosyltransferase